MGNLQSEHLSFERLKSLDASIIIPDLLNNLGVGSITKFITPYLKEAQKLGRLEAIIPKNLIDQFKSRQNTPSP